MYSLSCNEYINYFELHRFGVIGYTIIIREKLLICCLIRTYVLCQYFL